MLGTVQFYYQFCLIAKEIYNIAANHILATDLDRVSFQKIIPKVSFFFGHILSKALGITTKVFAAFHNKYSSIPHPASLRSATITF